MCCEDKLTGEFNYEVYLPSRRCPKVSKIIPKMAFNRNTTTNKKKDISNAVRQPRKSSGESGSKISPIPPPDRTLYINLVFHP